MCDDVAESDADFWKDGDEFETKGIVDESVAEIRKILLIVKTDRIDGYLKIEN